MEMVGGVPAHRAREYETIYIVRPDAGEEAAQKVAGRVVETIDRLKGKLVEVQVWGRRRMAYKVRGHAKGLFIYLRYVGYPGLVEELERNFRMLDAVVKYQTVKRQHEIDPSTVTVDPAQIEFAGMDFSEEPEEEPLDSEGDLDEGGEGYLDDYEPEVDGPPRRRRSEDDDDDDHDESGARPGRDREED